MFALLVSQFALNLLYDSTQNIAPTSTHLTNLYLAVVVIDSNDTGSANSTTKELVDNLKEYLLSMASPYLKMNVFSLDWELPTSLIVCCWSFLMRILQTSYWLLAPLK